MRFPKTLAIIALFALATVGSYYVALSLILSVEQAARAQVEQKLRIAGYDWASVKTDGLQVILEGEAPTEAMRFTIMQTAGTIVKPTRLIDSMTVQAAQEIVPPDFSVEILRSDTSISLTGLVPSSSEKERLLSKVSSMAGDKPVENFIQTADYPAPPHWQSALRFGLGALAILPYSKITISKNSVQIVANAQDENDKIRIENRLKAQVPTAIRANIDISAPRPVITPFSLRLSMGKDGTKLKSCSSDGKQTRALFESALRDAGLTGRFECNDGLGAPSSDWAVGALLGIKALSSLGVGTLSITDTNMSFIIGPGPAQADYDTVLQRLEADLPPLFQLSSVLRLPPQEGDEDKNTQNFTATLSPEGHLRLQGAVEEGWSQQAVLSFTHSKFGKPNIFNNLSAASEDLPNGWGIRVMAGLEALSRLHSGMVDIQPDRLSVSGRTGNKQTNAIVSQILTNQLGKTAQYQLNITYEKSLDPNRYILPDATCVAEIGNILATQKITFEPGSDNFDTNSIPTIKKIAKLLERCPDAQIEIAGHTDSQGREQMNMTLSQTRAEAVLNALRGLRVENKALRAKGYGESHPISDNKTPEGREQNRRIEFTLIPTSEAAK